MARIEARLRGVQQQVDSAEARVLGNLILGVETRVAQVSGKKIKLTALESDMLQYFMVRGTGSSPSLSWLRRRHFPF